jgi:hypothetical protein
VLCLLEPFGSFVPGRGIVGLAQIMHQQDAATRLQRSDRPGRRFRDTGGVQIVQHLGEEDHIEPARWPRLWNTTALKANTGARGARPFQGRLSYIQRHQPIATPGKLSR